MKYRTTKKAIRENYSRIYSIGYCNLQWLLKYLDPVAYSAGVNGWACDYYEVDGAVISTGYSPIGRKVDYDLQREYDEKARAIACNYSLSWEEQTARVNNLLHEFMEKIAA